MMDRGSLRHILRAIQVEDLVGRGVRLGQHICPKIKEVSYDDAQREQKSCWKRKDENSCALEFLK